MPVTASFTSATVANSIPSPRTTFSETSVDFDVRRQPYETPIDIAEHEYRTRYQPTYHREEARTNFGTTVDSGRFPQQPQQQSSFVEESITVDAPRALPKSSTYRRTSKLVEDIPEPSSLSRKSDKMGYYDEEGEFFFPFFCFVRLGSQWQPTFKHVLCLAGPCSRSFFPRPLCPGEECC